MSHFDSLRFLSTLSHWKLIVKRKMQKYFFIKKVKNMEISNNKKMAPRKAKCYPFEESLLQGKPILPLLCKENIKIRFILESPRIEQNNYLTQSYLFLDFLRRNCGYLARFLCSWFLWVWPIPPFWNTFRNFFWIKLSRHLCQFEITFEKWYS